jgi:HPt (histidine-containing phosphotransfer) domain-containing protein
MTPTSSGPFAQILSGALDGNRYRDVQDDNSPSPHESPGTLESDVGPDVYRDLLAAFLAHLSLQRIELGAALANDDIASAQGVAHQIKGTALNFGAARLDELAKRLLEIDTGEPTLFRSLVTEIETEIRSLQAVVGV